MRTLAILLLLVAAPAATNDKCDPRDHFNLPKTELLHKAEMVKLGMADIIRTKGFPCEHVWHMRGAGTGADEISCFVLDEGDLGRGELAKTDTVVYIVNLQSRRGVIEVRRR